MASKAGPGPERSPTEETLVGDPSGSLRDTVAAATRRHDGGAALDRGATVGRYVVVERLGSGGMGVVYAAFDPELDRKVALKLLHGDAGSPTDSTAGRTRLLREAQAMARLSHPNVIAVHDVGTFSGQVFVAMEYVEGSTLGEWLAERPRAPSEILQVFVAAGEGLAAAHAAGIVHRDFKPDNVMIDRSGRTRVLDFGLARPVVPGASAEDEQLRALSSSASSIDVVLTATGALMGTPAYMAPEQHVGQALDHRTDQFAFCVALWEALYGERPFAGDTLPVLAFQVTQGKLREPPRRPGIPRSLRRALERGLSGHPDDRHASMTTLLAEIRRDPRRTRRRTLAGVAIFAAVAGGTAGFYRSLPDPLGECLAGSARLDAAWNAEQAAALEAAFAATGSAFRAQAFARSRAALDDFAERWRAGLDDACKSTFESMTTSRADFELRSGCLQHRLDRVEALLGAWQDGPDAEAILRAPEATAGLPDPRECDDLAALRRAVPPPEDPQVAHDVESLRRELEGLRAQRDLGQVRKAIEPAEALVERARTLGHDPALAEALVLLGTLDVEIARPQQALAHVDEGLFLAEASGHDELAADAWLADLVIRLAMTSDYAAAERASRRADAAIRRIGDPVGKRIRWLDRRGVLLHAQDRDPEAEAAQLEALALLAEHPDPGHEGDVRNNYSTTLKGLRRYEDARAQLELARSLWSRQLGEGHPKVGRALVNLANVESTLGQHEQAIRDLQAALTIFRGAYGDVHPNIAAALNGLGLMSETMDRAAQAKPHYEEALRVLEATVGLEHAHTANIYNNLGNVTRTLGEYEESVAWHERSLALKRKIYGDDSYELAYCWDNIGQTHLAAGHHDLAAEAFRRSLQHLESLGAEHLLDQAWPLMLLGRVENRRHRPDAALPLLERALALRREHAGDPDDVAEVALELATALAKLKRDPARVRELGRMAVEGLADTGPSMAASRDRARAFAEGRDPEQ
jgi:tetratricopeptide (TPR) repeat protein